MRRRCLDCAVLISAGSRCRSCEHARDVKRSAFRGGRAAWQATVEYIRDRDGHLCGGCGAPCPHPRHHEVDHRVPLEQGGSNDPSNLWLLCAECHVRKTVTQRFGRPGWSG